MKIFEISIMKFENDPIYHWLIEVNGKQTFGKSETYQKALKESKAKLKKELPGVDK